MGNLLGKVVSIPSFAQQCQRRSADYIGIDRFKASQYHQKQRHLPITLSAMAAPFINAESAWYKLQTTPTLGESTDFLPVLHNTRVSSLVQYVNDTLHFIKSLVSTVLQICQYDAVLLGISIVCRAMRRNTGCTSTMVGLPQFGYTSVISYEKKARRAFR